MNKELQLRQKIQSCRMQENLTTLRLLAGWTMEDLGDRLGCSKQSISLLEKKKSEMSFIQCIAIRTVLGMEAEELTRRAEENKDDEMNAKAQLLKNAMSVLLDMAPEDVPPEVKASFEAAARAAKGGISRVILQQLLPKAATAVGMGVGVAVAGTAWLLKTMSEASASDVQEIEEKTDKVEGEENG